MGSTYHSVVSMQPIFLPPQDMIGICACCNTNENTTLCRYVCEYRPRSKDVIRYNIRSCEAYIDLYLCPYHRNVINNEEHLKILGWDWSDMVEGLP